MRTRGRVEHSHACSRHFFTATMTAPQSRSHVHCGVTVVPGPTSLHSALTPDNYATSAIRHERTFVAPFLYPSLPHAFIPAECIW